MTYDEARSVVQGAICLLLEGDEIPIAWTLTIDVAGQNGTRYLAHRAGGGIDGNESPTVWAALGMLKASIIQTEEQLRDCGEYVEDEEDDVEEGA